MYEFKEILKCMNLKKNRILPKKDFSRICFFTNERPKEHCSIWIAFD